jgi:hypothetical protein
MDDSISKTENLKNPDQTQNLVHNMFDPKEGRHTKAVQVITLHLPYWADSSSKTQGPRASNYTTVEIDSMNKECDIKIREW